MLKNRLVLIPSSIPWNWSADYVRQTALRLGKDSLVWVFIWTEVPSLKELWQRKQRITLIKNVAKNVYLFTPIQWLPFKRFRRVVEWNLALNYWIFLWLAGMAARKRGITSRVHWLFDPFFNYLKWSFETDTVVYDAVDFFAGAQKGEARKQFDALEADLLTEATVVTANSHVLLAHCKIHRSDTLLVPQGFDSRAFSTRDAAVERFKKHPVIGYVGGLNYRLDYDLLDALVARNPTWTFVLWGPIQAEAGDGIPERMAALKAKPNVVTGQSNREQLAGIIAQFDAAIIPYSVDSAFDRYCFPMKLFEYLYVGTAIVASDIVELRHYPQWVTIADSPAEWEQAIRKAISRKLTIGEKAAQRRLALAHDWDKKLEMITSRVASIGNGR